MTEKNDSQIKMLDARRAPVRIFLGAAILLMLVFAWFAARWQIGDMMAEQTTAGDDGAKELSQLAVSLAPSDPSAKWLAASAEKDIYTPEKLAASLRNYESVVRLAPNDYRWWVALGRAREQADLSAPAEQSLLQAVNLAPDYVYPRWVLGNFYLRQNRSDEGFAELKKVAQPYSIYRDQVFSVAWDYFDKNPAKLEELAGDSASVKAFLAKFFAAHERPADAVRVWNTLTPEEKQANTYAAREMAQYLYEKRAYAAAINFVRDLGIEPDAKDETLQNGGFETGIGEAKDAYYGWRVWKLDKMEVQRDSTLKREGARSLRVTFSGFAGAELYNIQQIVTVKPGAKYVLSFWLRTENLKSAGMPTLEIVNANTDKIIAASPAFPSGTNDWQPVKIEFAAPADAEAVTIRTTRSFCGSGCPLIGTFWYDDFSLAKL